MASEAPRIGMVGLGMYVPPQVVTAHDLSEETGVPEDVLRAKFGIRQVHRAGPDCHVSDMAVAAARNALTDAQISAEDLDLVVYCGSEWKDYVVWSAASHITFRLGATRAEAYEVYALCAGTPITLRIVKDMMCSENSLRNVLVVAASKESALVNRHNSRTRFMFNFGDGAGACVLQRDANRNLVLGSASKVDGSLSEDAVMPAGGSRLPASAATVGADQHYLDVPDIGRMRTRLEHVSGENFLAVVRQALQRSGRDNIDFLAPVHMKRSMHDWLRRDLNADRAYYLEDYGHMQAADQLIILHEARQDGSLRNGDTVVLAAAGVGYTWSASVLAWGPAQP